MKIEDFLYVYVSVTSLCVYAVCVERVGEVGEGHFKFIYSDKYHYFFFACKGKK